MTLRHLPAFAFVAAVLLGLASCGSPPPSGPLHMVERIPVLFGEGSPVVLERAGESRQALRVRVPPGSILRTPFADLPEGSLEFAIAAADAQARRIEVTLTSGVLSPRTVARCGIDFPARDDEQDRWMSCRLHWKGRLRRPTVTLGATDADGEITLEVSQTLRRARGPVSGGPVFVFLWDTVRADFLRTWGGPQELGTSLAALADDGITFAHMRAVSSWTRPSTASLLSGVAPMRHRAISRTDVLPAGIATLAEVLAGAGFETFAWSLNPNVLPIWGFGQGFDRFIDPGSQRNLESKVDGGVVLSQLTEFLQETGDVPALYYVHLMDAHDPFQPSPADAQAAAAILKHTGLGEQLLSPIMRVPALAEALRKTQQELLGYVGELLDLDRSLGEFLDELRRLGLYENSTIVVVSDHGEEFGDHGGLRHGRTLYEEQLRVPAVLKLPGNRLAGTEVAGIATHVDLLPTLLGALGLAIPDNLDGRDRLAVLADTDTEVFVASLDLDGNVLGAATDGVVKLIVNHRAADLLFDLDTDPKERRPLKAEVLKVERDRLARRIEADQTLGRPGWHLMACGGKEDETLELEIGALVGVPEAEAFEAEDALVRGESEGQWRWSADLRGRDTLREQFARIVNVREWDHDEVWIAPSESPEASVAAVDESAARGVPILLGHSEQVRRRNSVTLKAVRDWATASPGDVFRCELRPRASRKDDNSSLWLWGPHLRLWYVEPREVLEESGLEQGLRDRLQNLGYME